MTSPGPYACVLRTVYRLRCDQNSTLQLREIAGANDRLTTQMKSVGEVMAIGRTQQESLLRGLEVGATGFDPKVSPTTRKH